MASPDPFSFTDVTGQPFNTVVTSNAIVLAGTGGPFAVSVSSSFSVGEWEKNGDGNWSNLNGSAVIGDSIRVRGLSNSAPSTVTSVTLNVDAASDVFTITTVAVDTTPDAFNFGDLIDVERATTADSNEIVIAGINTEVTASVTGGFFSYNGGPWVSTPVGNVINGDRFRLRLITSGLFVDTVSATLTVGGTADTWNVTTRAADVTPNAFSFTDVSGAAVSPAVITSNTVTINGIEGMINVTFAASGVATGHEYKKDSGAWTAIATPATAVDGTTFQLRLVAPVAGSATGSIKMTANGVADTWSVTTIGDVLPDSFTFADTLYVIPGSKETQQSSPIVQVTGITAQCVASATYCDMAADVASPPTPFADPELDVDNNDFVRAKTKVGAPIPGCGQQTLAITVSIGSGTATWNIKTKPGMPAGQVTC